MCLILITYIKEQSWARSTVIMCISYHNFITIEEAWKIGWVLIGKMRMTVMIRTCQLTVINPHFCYSYLWLQWFFLTVANEIQCYMDIL